MSFEPQKIWSRSLQKLLFMCESLLINSIFQLNQCKKNYIQVYQQSFIYCSDDHSQFIKCGIMGTSLSSSFLLFFLRNSWYSLKSHLFKSWINFRSSSVIIWIYAHRVKRMLQIRMFWATSWPVAIQKWLFQQIITCNNCAPHIDWRPVEFILQKQMCSPSK